MKIRLTEEIWKEGNMYVSYCPELDIPLCGESVEQTRKVCLRKQDNGISRSDALTFGAIHEIRRNVFFIRVIRG